MSTFEFKCFMDWEGCKMARVETSERCIPLNVVAEEGTDFDLADGEACEMEVAGLAPPGYELRFYDSEEAFSAENGAFAPAFIVPTGTFQPDENGANDGENPDVLFAGKVILCKVNPNVGSKPDAPIPNAMLLVRTLEDIGLMTVFTNLDKPVEPFCIVRGRVRLCGVVKRKQAVNFSQRGVGCENKTRKENEVENTEGDKPAWGAGMFALLCFLSLFPIVGLIVGLINVKHKPRVRQARALIIINVISMIINACCMMG